MKSLVFKPPHCRPSRERAWSFGQRYSLSMNADLLICGSVNVRHRCTHFARTMTLLFGLSALLSACANHSFPQRQFDPKSGEVAVRAFATDGIFTDWHRATRAEVLAFLRSEGILSSTTQVVSADWKPKLSQWLIILRHASGVQSHWLVDASNRNYTGGICIR